MREIDALGGEMGKVADKTFIQSKILNRGKGPAVHSLRAQIDRRAYQIEMKHRLELAPNLDVKQAEITDILVEDSAVCGVVTATGDTLWRACSNCGDGHVFRRQNINRRLCARVWPDRMFAATAPVRVVKKFRYQNPALLRRYAGAYPTQQCRFFCDGA